MQRILPLLLSTAILLLTACGQRPTEPSATVAEIPSRPYDWEKDFGPGPFPNAIKGSDQPEKIEDTGEGRLYYYDSLTVAVRDNSESIGEVIRYLRPGREDYDELPFVEAGFFAGRWAGYLLVDEGTGPEYRQLTLFDPDSGDELYTTTYNGALIEGDELVIARPIDETAVDPKPDCSRQSPPDGMSVGYMEIIKVNAQELIEQPTGQVLCYFRQ